MNRISTLRCDKDYHRKIKKEAAEQGLSIIRYTKKIAAEVNFFKSGEKVAWKKNKNKPKFKFDF